MKLADIKERLDQRPFRPFAIETVGGSWIDVDKESSVLISERRPDLVVVFDPNGRLYILGVDQISALEGK
jgi:hypothetical protein